MELNNVVFKLGTIGHYCATKAVAEKMQADNEFQRFITSSLHRFHGGDWGEMSNEDKESNNEALEYGDRILARYENLNYKPIYIVADAKAENNLRLAVTIMFPEEY